MLYSMLAAICCWVYCIGFVDVMVWFERNAYCVYCAFGLCFLLGVLRVELCSWRLVLVGF